MRYLLFLFFSFSLLSCNKNEEKEPATESVNLAEIDFATPQIALVGDARSLASGWEEYQRFETAMENYDHSEQATARLAMAAQEMEQDINMQLNNQPIRSRLIVLISRIKAYESFLQYRVKTAAQHQEYYNAIIVALDNFNNQLNEKSQVDRMQLELIEELKNDLQDFNSMATDSIP